jgi:hypothetical protein
MIPTVGKNQLMLGFQKLKIVVLATLAKLEKSKVVEL